MERADRTLSIHYGARSRRLYSCLSRAGVPCRSSEAYLQACVAHGALVFDRGAAAFATSSGASGAFAGDVLYAAQHISHGDVRLRIPLVPDGSTRIRNMARL